MAGGDHGAAAATVHGDDGLERERGKGEVSIRSRCSPRARWHGRRGVGRTVAAVRSSAEPRPWRRRPGRCRRLRAPRHGPVAPGRRGGRGGPGRHLRRARGGAGRRRLAGDGGGPAAVGSSILGLGLTGKGERVRVGSRGRRAATLSSRRGGAAAREPRRRTRRWQRHGASAHAAQ